MKKIVLLLVFICIASPTLAHMKHQHHIKNCRTIDEASKIELSKSLSRDELRLEYQALDHHLNKMIKRRHKRMNRCMSKKNWEKEYDSLKKEINELQKIKKKLRKDFMKLYREEE